MADQEEVKRTASKILEKAQYQALKDEMVRNLKRAARQSGKLNEMEKSNCTKSELTEFYSTLYDADEATFEQKASKMFYESIQRMQCVEKQQSTNEQSFKSESKIREIHTPSWNQSILGKKILIYWPLDKKYYKGIVSRINESKLKPIYVKYTDGDKEWLDLKKEKFSFYEISSDEDTESETYDDGSEDMNESDDIDIDIDLSDDDDDSTKRRKKRKKSKKKRKKKRSKKKKRTKKRKKSKIDEIKETEIKKKDSPKSPEPMLKEQSEEKVDENANKEVLIDMHCTILIDGNRYDGIVEDESNDSDGNVIYKVKFDSSNFRQSEWVKRNQIETQKIVTCDNFKTGDNVQVRENGNWMDPNDASGIIKEIFEGATGAKIYKVGFPELGDYYMYQNERDIRKY